MRYYEIAHLFEGFREVERKFIEAGIDQDEVKKAIELFRTLVNKNQVKGNERNIDWWGKNKTFAEFAEFINDKNSAPTKTQQKRGKAVGKSINLIDNDQWLVVIPLDKDASCFHGRGSAWCTTKPHQSNFEHYFYNSDINLIYCLNKETGGMWAIAWHVSLEDTEMFNQQDEPISSYDFKRETGLDPYELIKQAHKHLPDADETRGHYKNRRERAQDRLSDDPTSRDEELEKDLVFVKDNDQCDMYLRDLVRAKVPLDGIPEPILMCAVHKEPMWVLTFPNPPASVMTAALEKQPTYIKSYASLGWTVTQKMLAVALQERDTRKELLDWAIEQGFEIPESVVKSVCKHAPLAAYGFMRVGVSVPDNLIIAAIKDSPYSVPDYYEAFANVSEPVQMALVEADPDHFMFIKNPAPAVRAYMCKNAPRDFMRELFWKGLMLTPEEIATITERGISKDEIARVLESETDRLFFRIHEIRRHFQDYSSKEIRRLQKKVDALKAGLTKFEHDPEIADIIRKEIDRIKGEADRVTTDLKQDLAAKNDYAMRHNNLKKSAKTAGF